jgi:hypothetical protein
MTSFAPQSRLAIVSKERMGTAFDPRFGTIVASASLLAKRSCYSDNAPARHGVMALYQQDDCLGIHLPM